MDVLFCLICVVVVVNISNTTSSAHITLPALSLINNVRTLSLTLNIVIIFLIAYTNNNNNILQQTHHHQIIIISGRYNDKVNSIAIPFLPRPSALDGSHAGDYGFDPLGLSEKLDFYAMQESEVRHARYVQFFFLPLSLWQQLTLPTSLLNRFEFGICLHEHHILAFQFLLSIIIIITT